MKIVIANHDNSQKLLKSSTVILHNRELWNEEITKDLGLSFLRRTTRGMEYYEMVNEEKFFLSALKSGVDYVLVDTKTLSETQITEELDKYGWYLTTDEVRKIFKKS